MAKYLVVKRTTAIKRYWVDADNHEEAVSSAGDGRKPDSEDCTDDEPVTYQLMEED